MKIKIYTNNKSKIKMPGKIKTRGDLLNIVGWIHLKMINQTLFNQRNVRRIRFKSQFVL